MKILLWFVTPVDVYPYVKKQLNNPGFSLVIGVLVISNMIGQDKGFDLENPAFWLIENIFGQYIKVKNFPIYTWGGFTTRKVKIGELLFKIISNILKS